MVAFNRRSFLAAAGAAGAAGIAPAIGRSAAPQTPCRLILVSAGGGWDTSYALDPKPGLSTVDAPEGEVQDYGDLPIFVHESRPNVSAFFDAYADRTAVIQGIAMRSISHITCGQRIYTGNSSTGGADAAAIVGHELGRELPLPYLVLGSVAFSGTLGVSTARVGAINQINSLLQPNGLFPELAQYDYDRFEATDADEALIRDFLERRAERQQATRGALGYNRARIEDFRESLQRSDAVRAKADAFGEFAFSFAIEDQVDLAIRALAEDLSWTVGIDSRLDWDTHAFNEAQGFLHETLFAGLRYLAEQLEATPGSSGKTLLDETLVVVMSEMSRTPLLNAAGGKDHWPTTSMMMFGGPVGGGRSLGGSNEVVEPELIDLATGELDTSGQLLEPRNIIAGLIEVAGTDPTPYLADAEPFHAPFV